LLGNPDACSKLKEWVRKNLDGLTTDKMHDYVHNTMIPALIRDTSDCNEDEVQSRSTKEYLEYYGIKTIAPSSIYCWMKALGMKYNATKSNDYVDGHEREREESVRYR